MNWFVIAGIWLSISLANAGLLISPAPTFVEPYQPSKVEKVEEKPNPKKTAPVERTETEEVTITVGVSSNILRLINQVRTKHAIAPLQESSTLVDSASRSVANMIRHRSCCDHGDWQQWFVGTGYSWYGENIAACQVTDQEVVDAWVSSPPHLKNILDPDFTYGGVYKALGPFKGDFSGGEQINCIYYANHFGG